VYVPLTFEFGTHRLYFNGDKNIPVFTWGDVTLSKATKMRTTSVICTKCDKIINIDYDDKESMYVCR
jgi:hypothetical protein